jgi:hypothetical protein
MLGAGCGNDQERFVAFLVESVTDVLAGRPLLLGGERHGKADPFKAFFAVEQSHTSEIDAPPPQVARQGPSGWEPRAGQGAVPLGPGRGRFVGEIPRLDHVAVLPAPVGGVGRLVERVAAVGDVANEAAVDGADVDIKGRHLRNRCALEGSDKARDAAIVAAPDGIDGSAVIEASDGLDQPDRNVGGLHDVSEALDKGSELQGACGMFA